jgi:hypothetical protein
MAKPFVPLCVGCLTGVALLVSAACVVLMFGPETLLDWDEAVYDSAGQYMGLR